VALKVMRDLEGSREALRRFEYEIEILGLLRHPRIAQVYEAGTYKDEGQYELALPLYLEDHEVSVRTQGAEHPDTLVSATNLAATYLALGRFEEAAKLLEPTVAASRKSLGNERYGTGFALCAYGESLLGLERYEEAEAALLESRSILLSVFGAGDPNLRRPEEALLRIYADTGRDEEAAALRAGKTR
jgi:tetratricopeptide (TPR) repeat protein